MNHSKPFFYSISVDSFVILADRYAEATLHVIFKGSFCNAYLSATPQMANTTNTEHESLLHLQCGWQVDIPALHDLFYRLTDHCLITGDYIFTTLIRIAAFICQVNIYVFVIPGKEGSTLCD